jgi:hypothetical protein
MTIVSLLLASVCAPQHNSFKSAPDVLGPDEPSSTPSAYDSYDYDLDLEPTPSFALEPSPSPSPDFSNSSGLNITGDEEGPAPLNWFTTEKFSVELNYSNSNASNTGIQCGHVFLGWHSGHVGMATAADPGSYLYKDDRQQRSYKFMFEFGKMQFPKWAKGVSVEEQALHARAEYLPHWSRRNFPTANATEHELTCVDLSHVNLLFMDGLIHELVREHKKITVVRVRRPYYESALSLLASYTQKLIRDNEGCDYTRNAIDGSEVPMCPLAQGASGKRVVLTVPPHVWNKWSLFQRILWQIDEVEAQFERLREEYHDYVHFEEVDWSTADDNFPTHALPRIAHILGIKAIPRAEKRRSHLSDTQEFNAYVVIPEQAAEVRNYVEDMIAYSPNFQLRDCCKAGLRHEETIELKVAKMCTTLMGQRRWRSSADHGAHGTLAYSRPGLPSFTRNTGP